MANDTAKTLIAFYDKVKMQLNQDNSYAKAVMVDSIAPGALQNSNNVYWRNVEQQVEVQEGWDLTGQEQDTIEQGYPLQLGLPKNVFKGYRVDDLRDEGFMERSVRAAAKRLSSDQNKRIADLVADTGSMYYESSSTGYDFVAEADTLLTERQGYRDESSFYLSPRANQVMAGNLASRTLQGNPSNRSETAYGTALIGENVAGFDLLRAPTYGNVPAAAAGTTTVAADVLDVPQGFTESGGTITNIDYRVGTVTLTDAATFQVGDVITFAGVNALGVNDKTDTEQLMTAKVVDIQGNVVNYYPKLIAADQAGITDAEAAYANISTAIVSGMVVSKVNTVGGQANSFWANDSIAIVNGDAPLELLNEFAGMKVVSSTLDSGVKLYMAYDADLSSLQCKVRLFTWYGLVNSDPSRNGNAIYTP